MTCCARRIQGISEVITLPGIINLDFADVRRIMSEAGPALLAIGQGRGENRAADAARAAITSPLLDDQHRGRARRAVQRRRRQEPGPAWRSTRPPRSSSEVVDPTPRSSSAPPSTRPRRRGQGHGHRHRLRRDAALGLPRGRLRPPRRPGPRRRRPPASHSPRRHSRPGHGAADVPAPQRHGALRSPCASGRSAARFSWPMPSRPKATVSDPWTAPGGPARQLKRPALRPEENAHRRPLPCSYPSRGATTVSSGLCPPKH